MPRWCAAFVWLPNFEARKANGEVFMEKDTRRISSSLSRRFQAVQERRFSSHKTGMENYFTPDDFERCFVRVVVETIEQTKGMNHARFARQLQEHFPGFSGPDPESSVVKWRRIRNGSKDGKKQGLSLCEAHAMALALKQDFPALAFTAQQLMRTTCKPSQTTAA